MFCNTAMTRAQTVKVCGAAVGIALGFDEHHSPSFHARYFGASPAELALLRKEAILSANTL